jgi:TolA-binding protein
VTYSEPAVADEINQRFVPVQVNTQEGAAKPLIERYRQTWTPDLRLLAPDGFELYRWNGYLPPFELLPQLLVAQAHGLLRLDDLARAAAVYAEVLQRFPTSAVAPEAQYFLAVSKYKASHEGSDLLGGWKQLQDRYPDSIWRVKQSFTEDG